MCLQGADFFNLVAVARSPTDSVETRENLAAAGAGAGACAESFCQTTD